jgi:hypothetical protein
MYVPRYKCRRSRIDGSGFRSAEVKFGYEREFVHIINCSKTGLRFSSNKSYKPGNKIQLFLKVDKFISLIPLRISAKVRNVYSDGSYGVQFIFCCYPFWEAVCLDKLIYRQLKKQGRL